MTEYQHLREIAAEALRKAERAAARIADPETDGRDAFVMEHYVVPQFIAEGLAALARAEALLLEKLKMAQDALTI